MRQQIPGIDGPSRLPNDPVFVYADEEAGRIRALELGAVVASVEVIHRSAEETKPGAERQISAPAAMNVASPDGRKPRPRRKWLFAGMFLLVLAVGFGTARLWSSGVRVSHLPEVENVWRIAGQESLVFEYSGGQVEFWAEIESQGKMETIGRILSSKFYPDTNVRGHFILLRGKPDETGHEDWTFVLDVREMGRAHALELIADMIDDVSNGQPVMPLVLETVSMLSESNLVNWKSRKRAEKIQVWKGNRPKHLFNLEKSVGVSIPSSLPPDQDVCLGIIKEWRRPDNMPVPVCEHWALTALGLFAAPQPAPVFIAAALAHPSFDSDAATINAAAKQELLTIRIMCRAVSRDE